jgi:lysozyme family protein
MADFNIAIETVLANEGSTLVDDPLDPGGLSRWGISHRSYPLVDIRNLTEDQAKQIYLRDFWKYEDVIEQRVATKLLDSAVNLGEHAATFLLQEIVLQVVKPDGLIGPVTLDCVNRVDPNALLTAYRAKLEQHYRNIVLAKPEEMKFLDGWLRRAKQ